jgi:hypothetical protein
MAGLSHPNPECGRRDCNRHAGVEHNTGVLQ